MHDHEPQVMDHDTEKAVVHKLPLYLEKINNVNQQDEPEHTKTIELQETEAHHGGDYRNISISVVVHQPV